MREYKFRGKRIDNGEWTCGDLIQLLGKQGQGRKFIVDNRFGACIDSDGSFVNTEAPFVNEIYPETVGEYTGLKDRNGNEVYEGDVLDYRTYAHSDVERVGIVEFDINRSCYKIRNKNDFDDKSAGHSFDKKIMAEASVIGNIYEHPHLLTKEETK